MDFSLDWFLSIPGLLISGGVLLFLIALILLIATMVKKKKEKNTVATATATNNEVPAQNPQAAQTAMPQATMANNSTLPEMNSPSVTGGTIMDIPAPTMPQAVPQMPDMNANMAMNTGMPMGAQPNMAMPSMDVTGGQMPAMQQPIDPTMQQPMVPPTQTPAQESMVAPTEMTPPTVESPQAPVVEPMVQNIQPQVTPEVQPIAPIEQQAPAMPSVEPIAPIEQQAPIMPSVEPIAPIEQQAPVMPSVEPIAPTVATPEPIAQQPVVQPEVAPTPVMPTVEPMGQPVTMEPTVQPTPVEVAPAMDPNQQPQQGPVIYGGASPIVPEININEQQHQIYGGANPLENTQSIPISNLTGQQNVVQTPTPEPTMVTPQVAPVGEQPTNIGQ